jgi:hypothetical protein
MNFLKDLDFENLVELLEYLENISNKETKEERLNFVEERIGNFFPNLSAIQEIELSYIINNRDRDSFELFKASYPNLGIDVEGRSVPKDKNYWEIRETSLESVYQFALEELSKYEVDKSKYRINSQVYNAKTLDELKNMSPHRPDLYIYQRKLFLDRWRGINLTDPREFNRVEKLLIDILGEKTNAFLIDVVEYCKSKNDARQFLTFLEHLFERIEILSLDKELTSETNRLFLENINTIINKNNKLYEII